PYGLYPAWLLGIVFNGATQSQYGNVDGAIIALALIVVPRQRQQPLARERFARVVDQGFQQVDLAAGKFYGFVAFAQLAGSRIESEGTKGYGLVFVERRGAFFSTQHGLDSSQQLARIKRLAQVVVRACLQAYDPVNGFIAGCQ